MLLAESCIELMCRMNAQDSASESTTKDIIEGRLIPEMLDMQGLVSQGTQGDSTSSIRLLIQDGVQEKLECYKDTIKKAADVPCAFVSAARHARDGAQRVYVG